MNDTIGLNFSGVIIDQSKMTLDRSFYHKGKIGILPSKTVFPSTGKEKENE